MDAHPGDVIGTLRRKSATGDIHCGLQVSLRPMSSATLSMTSDRSLSMSERSSRTLSRLYLTTSMVLL